MKLTKFRILGLVVVVIGALIYWIDSLPTALPFTIAGLLILLQTRKYGEQTWSMFMNSLKFKNRFWQVLLYDFLFWAVFVLITFAFASYLQSSGEFLGLVNLDGKAIISTDITGQNIAFLEAFFIRFFISFVLTIIAIILAFGLFSGLAWSSLLKEKFTKSVFKKYLGGSFILIPVIVILTLLMGFGVRESALIIVAIFLILLVLHFSMLLNYFLLKHRSIRKAILETVTHGVQLQKFILPYAYAAVIYLAIMILVAIVSRQQQITIIFSAIVALFYFAWFKKLIAELIKKW